VDVTRRTIAFRTDANSCIGMGHLIRCLSLARILDEEYSIVFLFTNTPDGLIDKFLEKRYPTIRLPPCSITDEPELVVQEVVAGGACALVMDGYVFDYDYQKKVHGAGFKTIYIDDLVSPRFCVDMLINQAAGVLPEQYTNDCDGRLLLGPKYALLRPEFLALARQESRTFSGCGDVFVSFGGADPANLTGRALDVLVEIAEIGHVDVLMGQLNPQGEMLASKYRKDKRVEFHFDQSARQVAAHMLRNDLAIIPSSTMLLEACAVGIPMITGIAADNQGYFARCFREYELSIDIGDWRKSTPGDLLLAMRCAMGLSAHVKLQQLRNQKRYVDGLSGPRIREGIATL